MSECTWEPSWMLPPVLVRRFNDGLSTSDISSDEETEESKEPAGKTGGNSKSKSNPEATTVHVSGKPLAVFSVPDRS